MQGQVLPGPALGQHSSGAAHRRCWRAQGGSQGTSSSSHLASWPGLCLSSRGSQQAVTAAGDEAPSPSGRGQDERPLSPWQEKKLQRQLKLEARREAARKAGVPTWAYVDPNEPQPDPDSLDSSSAESSSSSNSSSRGGKLSNADKAAQRELNSQQLEERVRGATTRQEIMAYVQSEHQAPLQPAELVFVLNQLAKLCEARSMNYRSYMEVQRFVGAVLTKYPAHVRQLNAYELVVLLTALARTRYRPSPEWFDTYFAASMVHMPTYGPGYLYMLLKSLLRMELQLHELKASPNFRPWMDSLMAVSQAKAWAYRGDEIVRTLSAVSQLRWRASPDWQKTFNAALKVKLETLEPPLLAQALAALSSQKQAPGPLLLRAMMAQLATKLPMFDDRDLASTAQALLLVRRMMNTDFFGDFMVEVARKADTFSAASLAFLLDAFACLVSRRLMLVTTPQPPLSTPLTHTLAAPISSVNGDSPNSSTLSSSSSAGSRSGSSRQLDLSMGPLPSSLAPRPIAPLPSTKPAAAAAGLAGGAGPAGPAAAAAPPQRPTALQPPSRPPSPSPEEVAELRPLPLDRTQLLAMQALRPSRTPSANARRGMQFSDRSRGNRMERTTSRSPAAAAADGVPPSAYTDVAGEYSPALEGWSTVLPAASPAWLRLMEARILEVLPEMHVSLAAMALRGLAMMGHALSPALLEAFFVHSLPGLCHGRTKCFVSMVQAVALSGYMPSGPEGEAAFTAWFAQLSRLAARRVYSPDQVCDMVSALASLPVRPPDLLLASMLTHTRRNRPAALRHTSPRRLALLVAALRRLQYRPDFGFMHSFAQAVRVHWTNAEPAELMAILVALAALAPPPLAVDERWVSEMTLMVQCRLEAFDGPCLASTLAALVALGSDPLRRGPTAAALPSPRFCDLACERLLELQRSLAPSHATSVLWALASLHQVYSEQQQAAAAPAAPKKRRGSTSSNGSTSNGSSGSGSTSISSGENSGVSWPGPSAQLVAAMVACAGAGVHRLSAAQVADLCWALPVLGQPLPAWLQQAREQAASSSSNGSGNGSGINGAALRAGSAGNGGVHKGPSAPAEVSTGHLLQRDVLAVPRGFMPAAPEAPPVGSQAQGHALVTVDLAASAAQAPHTHPLNLVPLHHHQQQQPPLRQQQQQHSRRQQQPQQQQPELAFAGSATPAVVVQAAVG